MNTQYIDNLPIECEPIANIFAALGDKNRHTIMLLFEEDEEIGLKSIVKEIPLSRSAIIHHLTTLQSAGLLVSSKRGREVYYRSNITIFYQAIEIFKNYIKNSTKKENISF